MVRIKQRYLLLNILYPASASNHPVTNPIAFQAPTPSYLNAGSFIAHLRNHITLLFGDFGLGVSLSSLKVVYLSTATSTVILRVPRDHHRLVWAALSHVTELPAQRRGGMGVPCVVRVVRVSGTIRKVEEELVRRAKREVVRARMGRDGAGGLGGPVGVPLVEREREVHAIEDLSGDEDESD